MRDSTVLVYYSIPFFVAYLSAFAVFAVAGALVRLNWSIAGGIGVIVAMVVLTILAAPTHDFYQRLPLILVPGWLCLLAAAVCWSWTPGGKSKT